MEKRAARRRLMSDMLMGAGDSPRSRAGAAVAPSAANEPISAEPGRTPRETPPLTPEWQPIVAITTAGPRAEALAALRQAHDQTCPHCTTATTHTQTVFGEGSPDAEIMFVGEAPGETEDRLGRPFVGRAGQKLDEMIQAMGLTRESVYIANILKSRPPDNRTPLPDEVAKCAPFLTEQSLLIRPRVLVPLGGPATQFLLQTQVGITRLRGIWATWQAPEARGCPDIPIMPTFHPAYLLRNYTAKTRGEVWNDLCAVLERLGKQAPLRARQQSPNS